MKSETFSFNESSGAIHFVALFVSVLLVASILLLSNWIKRTDLGSTRFSEIERDIEKLEAKIKDLESRLESDELIDRNLLENSDN